MYVLDEAAFLAMEASEPFAVAFVDGLRSTLCFQQCSSKLLRCVYPRTHRDTHQSLDVAGSANRGLGRVRGLVLLPALLRATL